MQIHPYLCVYIYTFFTKTSLYYRNCSITCPFTVLPPFPPRPHCGSPWSGHPRSPRPSPSPAPAPPARPGPPRPRPGLRPGPHAALQPPGPSRQLPVGRGVSAWPGPGALSTAGRGQMQADRGARGGHGRRPGRDRPGGDRDRERAGAAAAAARGGGGDGGGRRGRGRGFRGGRGRGAPRGGRREQGGRGAGARAPVRGDGWGSRDRAGGVRVASQEP